MLRYTYIDCLVRFSQTCISNATMVTRTRHNVTSYVQCLSCNLHIFKRGMHMNFILSHAAIFISYVFVVIYSCILLATHELLSTVYLTVISTVYLTVISTVYLTVISTVYYELTALIFSSLITRQNSLVGTNMAAAFFRLVFRFSFCHSIKFRLV
jgi:hypothetical protein